MFNKQAEIYGCCSISVKALTHTHKFGIKIGFVHTLNANGV